MSESNVIEVPPAPSDYVIGEPHVIGGMNCVDCGAGFFLGEGPTVWRKSVERQYYCLRCQEDLPQHVKTALRDARYPAPIEPEPAASPEPKSKTPDTPAATPKGKLAKLAAACGLG